MLADAKFLEEFNALDPESQKEYLFVENHPDIARYWYVDGMDESFRSHFKGILNAHDYLSPFRYQLFAERAAEESYTPVFLDDPEHIFSWVKSLDRKPDISLNSTFEGTINGLLPFQVQGFNFCRQLRGSILQTSTGTGKAVMATAITKHFREHQAFDIYFWVVKAHNKINSARFLKDFGDLESTVIDGSKAVRKDLWDYVYLEAVTGKAPIVVMNYEAFRNDYDFIEELVTDARVWICWDEMPTKLRSRGTKLYQAVCAALYTSKARSLHYPSINAIRPRYLTQLMLSATPIENSPEDFFNCVSGETLIESIGDITRAYKGLWNGPMIEFITASGTKLTIGPNHPVLTGRGWIKAKFLDVGDDIICRSEKVSSSGIKNLDEMPPSIANIFDSLRATCKSPRMKRASAFEFHGDGEFFKDKIEVVGADSFLPDETQSGVTQMLGESLFGFPHTDRKASFTGDCASGQGLNTVFSPEPRQRASSKETVRVTRAGSNLDPKLFEALSDSLLANIKLSSDCRTRQPLLHIEPSDFIDIQRNFSGVGRTHSDSGFMESPKDGVGANSNGDREFRDSFTSEISFDKVLNIKVLNNWVGHVYDLSTGSSIYYANGIALSNCVRLLDPTIYGSVRQFNETYVAGRNFWDEPNRWKNLDLMGAKAAPITFQVDKNSPDIAKQFPEINDIDLLIDLSDSQRKLYNQIMGEYLKLRAGGSSVFAPEHILSAIQVLQYLCDFPAAISGAAKAWEASGGLEGSEAASLISAIIPEKALQGAENSKLEALKDILDGLDPESKAVIFTPYNKSVMPYLSKMLDKWGYKHVQFHGDLSMAEKQSVQDNFIDSAGKIRAFLSSDAGSDSINLQVADTVIHYSLPWNWSTLSQRSNRVHRLSSVHKSITIYTFLCGDTVEERKMDILAEKYNYHKAVFMGDVNAQAEALRSGGDLEYILFGEQ